MYSQNSEEQTILDYFGEQYVGNLLEIGSNDGITLSNTFACLNRGWSGVLIEPSPKAFARLAENIYKRKGDGYVAIYNVAIGNTNDTLKFYESGKLLSDNDIALVSTLKESETIKWGKENFTEIEVPCITIANLFSKIEVPKFDLISIDCEGLDWDILQQINLKDVWCKMLIIEFNGVEKEKYVKYCECYGMKLISENAENLIFVRSEL